jgi:threonine dehydrogenase-like Zn-dependent dehydrogenase
MEAYKTFALREAPMPAPARGEVLVRVRACAVCGSDVHGIDGSTGRRQPPVIMGHEAAGEIALLGEGVTGYEIGDRVTFDSTVYCGECAACRAGEVNLCGSRRVLGVSCDEYRRDGAFAEFVAVPQRILYRLPEGVSFVEAAMVEPLSIACHAMTRTAVPEGGRVLVVGVGTIGLLALQVAKSLGAGRLIAADVDEARLQMAREAGAEAVDSRDPAALQKVLVMTCGTGVDVAVDCTGIGQTADLAIRSAKLNGAVVLVGNLAQKIDFPLQLVVTRQLSLFGSCASAGEYPRCLEMIASGQVDVQKMISKTVPLSEGGEWILKLYNREPGLYKVVLVP